MMQFDPFGWLERYVPETSLHRLIRGAMVLVLAAFLVLRIREYPFFVLKPLWLAETMIFAVLIAAFLLRSAPLDRSRGVREIIVPLLSSLLPFFLLLSPPALPVTGNRTLLYGVFWWMTAATALTVWGMWTLRRAFSITVEARTLVIGGPYRFVRHPVYLGEMLAAAGVALLRFSLVNGLLLVLFITLQLLRARWEEAKLARNFPEYREFASRSLWFW
jgi:protein-S-isoprenylcysteine O-methyltransferase Ste14